MSCHHTTIPSQVSIAKLRNKVPRARKWQSCQVFSSLVWERKVKNKQRDGWKIFENHWKPSHNRMFFLSGVPNEAWWYELDESKYLKSRSAASPVFLERHLQQAAGTRYPFRSIWHACDSQHTHEPNTPSRQHGTEAHCTPKGHLRCSSWSNQSRMFLNPENSSNFPTM